MAAIPASALGAVEQPRFVLQLSQGEFFDTIIGDTLLASSLLVNIVLAGLAILLFVFMAREVEDPRAQLIVVATILVPVVSISSYTGLLSGLTVGLQDPAATAILAEASHTVGGEEGVLSLWGRYLTWAFSTPAILLAIGLIAGSNVTKIFTAITFDVAMCITGLAAAFTTSSLALRWFWFALSTIFFLVVVYILLVEWPNDAEAAGTADVFNTLKLLTVVLWFGYPIVWALGAEGVAVLGGEVALTSWAYSLLDIGAKYIFAFLVINYVVDEPDSIRSGSDFGATVTNAAPADD